jgi:hypothetical protein
VDTLHVSSQRITRSQTETDRVYTNGTIVRRKFSTGYHEGEIVLYDPKEKYYKIEYQDGDTEEMTYMEVKQYRKKIPTVQQTREESHAVTASTASTAK